ncbi:MAG: T9SS type A sorting domain-containing protein [Chitinophagales bacterium]|nr:T9SS type A sorting domain-containing protein [Chitinophagales bacterium]
MKQIAKYFACALLMCSICILNSFPALAQNVQGSNSTASGINVTGTSGCQNTSTLTSLNLDMFDFASNASAPTPACIWGNGQDQYAWVTGFSGATTCTGTYAGITVGTSYTGAQDYQALPFFASSYAGNPVNDVDVAIGVHTDVSNVSYGNPGTPKYFVLAVYESNGEIWMESYDLHLDVSAGTVAVDVPTFTAIPAGGGPPYTGYITDNPKQLSSNANGTAGYPHIDLIYNDVYPYSGVGHEAIGYVVTWHQQNASNPAQYEVWGIDGAISEFSQNKPPTPHSNLDFYIDNGKYPDVTGITSANPDPTSPKPNKAYVTYLRDDQSAGFTGDQVLLADWVYDPPSTPVVNLYGAISSTTTGNDEFQYPRINGPQYYDYSTHATDDPVCVVAVTENDGASLHKVNTYACFDPSGTFTVIPLLDASDHTAGTGFNTNGYEAIKPVITGAGKIVSSLYAGADYAYRDYPTVFYSDYTYAVQNSPTYDFSGDFYAFGTDIFQTATPTIFKPSGNYQEANWHSVDLQTTTPFNLSGDEPYMAVATTNNSGHALMFAYWDKDWIYQMFTGATQYVFKPGKGTGIEQTRSGNIAVYPNPVKTLLNITQANGADYVMMDITGRSLSKGKISGDKAEVNVSSLAPGMYMLQLSKDGHTEQVKFVKQ